MKHLVPIHVANYVGSPGSVQSGYKKFYLKNGYFKLYDGASENDLVLDRPLDGFVAMPGTITPADTVLTALEKLDYAISNVSATTAWGTITGTITAQGDLMSYLSSNYYPSSNPAGFVSSTFVASNYYPLTANPAGYITQQSVLEFPNLAGFPIVGAPNTIYIALDTDIAYYWDGTGYVVLTTSTSGISGFGIVNRLAKFTPTGSAIGSSKIVETTAGVTTINWSARPLIGGNTILSIQRNQAQIDFILGNPGFAQPAIMVSDNQIDGFEIRSKGELAFKTGTTYANEGLRIFASGQLKLTQTPATGASTDFILLRDTSGNLKQIAYTTPSASTSTIKHIVKNNGTGLITKGTPVYVTGADGTNMLVGKASYTSEATSSKTMGLMESDITTTGGTQTGYVVTEGLLGGLNTAGTTAGDPVWLGPTGTLIYGLVNKPYAPNHLVFIGIVTKVSAGNGEIFVKVQNGFELKEIHDVDLITNPPVQYNILAYDGTLWSNKNIADVASERRNANNSTNNNINYCGTAPKGSSESATVWSIERLTIGSGGSVTIATATNVAWTNRESAIYI